MTLDGGEVFENVVFPRGGFDVDIDGAYSADYRVDRTDRLVVGEYTAATSCCFLSLAITSCCS